MRSGERYGAEHRAQGAEAKVNDCSLSPLSALRSPLFRLPASVFGLRSSDRLLTSTFCLSSSTLAFFDRRNEVKEVAKVECILHFTINLRICIFAL
jgi:hypothetical protein